MTDRTVPRFDELAPTERRRIVRGALVRAAVTSVALLLLYYLLPLGTLSSTASILVAAGSMVAILPIFAWQLRGILRADYPLIHAVGALALVLPLFLIVFAATYFLMEKAAPGSFTEPLSRTDALYFAVTTFSTVGYGDITARAEGARVAVMLQMVADLVAIGFGVRLVLGAVQMRRDRGAAARDGGPTSRSHSANGGEAE